MMFSVLGDGVFNSDGTLLIFVQIALKSSDAYETLRRNLEGSPKHEPTLLYSGPYVSF
jgi:hypothetical protein